MSRIWGRSMVGKYTSLRMPCETVYQTRLDAEYAVPTVSLAAEVQRPSSPGAPNAAPDPSTHLYSVSRTAINLSPCGSVPLPPFQLNRQTRKDEPRRCPFGD